MRLTDIQGQCSINFQLQKQNCRTSNLKQLLLMFLIARVEIMCILRSSSM